MMKTKKGKSSWEWYAVKLLFENTEYYNPYGQLVKCRFVDSLNCQRLFDDEIKSGTEIYSRMLKVPVEMETEKVIETYLTETLSCKEQKTPYYNFLIDEW